jgi:flagellar basal-body rod modification protein FlgD
MEISKSYTAPVGASPESKKKSQLSVDDFLKIMAAEIQNQNPTGDSSGSGSKTDYLTQLAQFTNLEQMSEISEGINQLNMLSQTTLIGKIVKIYGEKQDTKGMVDRVKFFNNQVYLQVKGTDYPIGLLMEVEESQKATPMEDLLLEVRDMVEESSESRVISEPVQLIPNGSIEEEVMKYEL